MAALKASKKEAGWSDTIPTGMTLSSFSYNARKSDMENDFVVVDEECKEEVVDDDDDDEDSKVGEVKEGALNEDEAK
jgi:hypothetical protein